MPLQRRGQRVIDPGSSWQNAWVGLFNRRLRDEFLNGWQFDSLLEAQVLVEARRMTTTSTDPQAPVGSLTRATISFP
jgi:putative transposase